MSRLRRLAQALEERTGLGAATRSLLEEAVPGGASWWYAIGAALGFLLVLELVTGVLLAFYYSPSAHAAWASTAFIQDQLTLGWFVRGLHSFGAAAMVVVAGLHFLQVIFAGAYKAPREVNWVVGLALYGLVVAFNITGYGLPWDQKGYWAKLVETSVIGSTPIIGSLLERILQGGGSYGNYTVTHFFTVHAFLLPAAMVTLVVVHLALVRRNKVTPSWRLSPQQARGLAEPYWPGQAFRDVVLSALTLLVVALLVIAFHGADLEGPADPASGYQARPEWYARPLFQLRLYFEGPLEPLATVILPGAVVAFLLAFPFIDRAPSRDPRQRLPLLAGTGLGLLGVLGLGFYSVRKDAGDDAYVKARAKIEEEARLARSLAGKGVLPEGGLAVYRNDPAYQTRELFREHCSSCHALTGQGGGDGPDLHDYNSRAWILSFLRNPYAPMYMGNAKKPAKGGMKPVKASDEDLAALTEFVFSQSEPPDLDRELVRKGLELFSEKNCDACHEIAEGKESDAPNLKHRGTVAYASRIIEDASRPDLYGERSKMQKFAGKLTAEQIERLARFVISQRAPAASAGQLVK